MISNRFISGILTAAIALALGVSMLSVSSCKRKGPDVAVTGITVTEPDLSLIEGTTAVLEYTVEPSDASNKAVSFSSSNEDVAKVDKNGKVTAVAPGAATITITTKDGGYTAKVIVTVLPEGSEIGPGGHGSSAVTGVILDRSELKIEEGTYDYLVATVLPETAANKAVEWESSKPAVAIVNDNGEVSAITQGSATITVTTKEGGFKASCDLLVVAKNSLHPYVEMGDGLRWSTCNLGASKPEEFGDFYAWGETKPYYKSGHALDKNCNSWESGKDAGYDWPSYSHANGEKEKLTKYCSNSTFGNEGFDDTLTQLKAVDDAAAQAWHSAWRMPTEAEWKTLRNTSSFKWEYTTNYKKTGVSGMIVTSKIAGYEGNSIFLPDTGHRYHTDYVQPGATHTCYWTSSLDTSTPYGATASCFESDGKIFSTSFERCVGFAIRPVYQQ